MKRAIARRLKVPEAEILALPEYRQVEPDLADAVILGITERFNLPKTHKIGSQLAKKGILTEEQAKWLDRF